MRGGRREAGPDTGAVHAEEPQRVIARSFRSFGRGFIRGIPQGLAILLARSDFDLGAGDDELSKHSTESALGRGLRQVGQPLVRGIGSNPRGGLIEQK